MSIREQRRARSGRTRGSSVPGAGTAPGPAAAAPGRLGLWLRASAFDYLLVLVASTALAMTVSFGFESAPDLRGNPLVCGGIAAVMLLVLFAGSWSKRAVVPAAIGAVVYALAVTAVFIALSPSPDPVFHSGAVNDSADSYFVFALVALAVPVLVYVLSRRRVGAIVLLVVGVFSCEMVQFLFRDWVDEGGTAVFLVALVALVALFVFQGYRSSVYAAQRLKKTSFGAAGALAVGMSAVCVLVGAGVFVTLISGLGITTPEIKPFKDYFTRPVMEYSGNYERQPVDDPDETTSLLSDSVGTTRRNTTGGDQMKSTEQDDSSSAESSVKTGTQTVLDASDWNEVFAAIDYQQLAMTALAVALLVAAAAAALVLLWRRRRTWRIRRIADESCAYRVWYLYGFLTERFRRVGFVRGETLTLMEFALAQRAGMLPYSRGCDADFLDVTLAYQRACYDEGRVTEEDYELVERYYWAFYKNARVQCSWYKWAFWRFWRL